MTDERAPSPVYTPAPPIVYRDVDMRLRSRIIRAMQLLRIVETPLRRRWVRTFCGLHALRGSSSRHQAGIAITILLHDHMMIEHRGGPLRTLLRKGLGDGRYGPLAQTVLESAVCYWQGIIRREYDVNHDLRYIRERDHVAAVVRAQVDTLWNSLL